jgi:tRNA A-37 threonylcarbamoyl transferase component Bud32
LRCAVDIVTALENLHFIGFSHGDIKMENICIKEENDIGVNQSVLIDFGLAHPLKSHQ